MTRLAQGVYHVDLPGFRAQTRQGTFYESYSSEVLRFHGFHVAMEPRRFRNATEPEFTDFPEEHDLLVNGTRVEVKSWGYPITGVGSLYDPHTVSKATSLDDLPYLVVSEVTGGMVALLPGTRRLLGLQSHHAQGAYMAMKAPRREFVEFDSFCYWLRRETKPWVDWNQRRIAALVRIAAPGCFINGRGCGSCPACIAKEALG